MRRAGTGEGVGADNVALIFMAVAEVKGRSGTQKNRLELKACSGGDASSTVVYIRAASGRGWPGLPGVDGPCRPVARASDL
eukprot:4740117-Pyramimonas_sp.AAC.1